MRLNCAVAACFDLGGAMRRSAIKEGVVLNQVLYALTDRDLSRTPSVA